MLFRSPRRPHSLVSRLPQRARAPPRLPHCSRPTRLSPSLSFPSAGQTHLSMRNVKGTTVLPIPIPRFSPLRLLHCFHPPRRALGPAIPPAEPAAPRSPAAATPFPDARAGPPYVSDHFPSATESGNSASNLLR